MTAVIFWSLATTAIGSPQAYNFCNTDVMSVFGLVLLYCVRLGQTGAQTITLGSAAIRTTGVALGPSVFTAIPSMAERISHRESSLLTLSSSSTATPAYVDYILLAA